MQANPYQAPKAEVLDSHLGRANFTDMTTRDLKKMKNHSINIRAMGSLWLLGILYAMVAFFVSDARLSVRLAYLLVSISVVLPIYGAWARPRWGRVTGIAFCALNLLGFPVGTLIGAIGLYAFIQGKPLFGPDRLLHSEILKEFKHRKRHGIG